MSKEAAPMPGEPDPSNRIHGDVNSPLLRPETSSASRISLETSKEPEPTQVEAPKNPEPVPEPEVAPAAKTGSKKEYNPFTATEAQITAKRKELEELANPPAPKATRSRRPAGTTTNTLRRTTPVTGNIRSSTFETPVVAPAQPEAVLAPSLTPATEAVPTPVPVAAAPETTPAPEATPSRRARNASADRAAEEYAANKKGILGKTGSFLGRLFTRPFKAMKEGLSFKAERIKAYGNMVSEKFFGDARQIRFEEQKAKFNVADGAVRNIEGELKEIEDLKASGEFIKPKEAIKMENQASQLRGKLVKAQEKRDEELRKTKYQEGLAVSHENKKKLIAEGYANLINERFKPLTEKFNEHTEEKAVLDSEIGNWRELIEEHSHELESLREDLVTYPHLKKQYKKEIKDIEKNILQSQQEIAQRTKHAIALDVKILNINDKLKVWDNKKQAYARFAAETVTPFDPEQQARAEIGGYRAPDGIQPVPDSGGMAPEAARVNPLASGGAGARPEATPTPVPHPTPAPEAAPANVANANQAERGQESKESPNEFEFEDWTKTWNALNGSKMKVTLESLFSKDLADHHRSVKTKVTRAQFASLVGRAHKASKEPNKGKLEDKDFTSVYNLLASRARKTANTPPAVAA